METITFDKLLLKTAFCCMASDGNIDKKQAEAQRRIAEREAARAKAAASAPATLPLPPPAPPAQ